MKVIQRKYTIGALINVFAPESQKEIKEVLSILLNITPQMLNLYINARKEESQYQLSTDKLQKIKGFFGLQSTDDLFTNSHNIDMSVLSAFRQRVKN